MNFSPTFVTVKSFEVSSTTEWQDQHRSVKHLYVLGILKSRRKLTMWGYISVINTDQQWRPINVFALLSTFLTETFLYADRIVIRIFPRQNHYLHWKKQTSRCILLNWHFLIEKNIFKQLSYFNRNFFPEHFYPFEPTHQSLDVLCLKFPLIQICLQLDLNRL